MRKISERAKNLIHSDFDNGPIVGSLLPSELGCNGPLRLVHPPLANHRSLRLFPYALNTAIRLRGLLLLYGSSKFLRHVSHPNFM
jgi:hypothetical protein